MDSPITFTGCLPIPSNSKNGNHTEKKEKETQKILHKAHRRSFEGDKCNPPIVTLMLYFEIFKHLGPYIIAI